MSDNPDWVPFYHRRGTHPCGKFMFWFDRNYAVPGKVVPNTAAKFEDGTHPETGDSFVCPKCGGYFDLVEECLGDD